jgi:predicted dehydrogenase
MQKKTLRAGIVGSGFAANFHFEALNRVYGANVSIAGVYSPTEKNRITFAEKRDLRAFDSLEALLEVSDVIHVCSPPVTHEPVAVSALKQDKWVIVEKPFTGYFGDGSDSFNGDTFPRQSALDGAIKSIQNMLDAESKSQGKILYAENWVYAPSVQKEREVLEKTGGQILWMHGEESHSGSHSSSYGIWKFSGGGSLMGKGCHPLTAALYLKHVEGNVRNGRPIRPVSVSARTHAVTRSPEFRDEGHLRANYTDIEDFSMTHIVFEDGMFADIYACELVMGGVHNWLEVNANNHRAICNINPNTAMQTYNPVDEQFKDIYVVEKIGTKQGWAPTSPDEDWFTGYQHEMEDFYRNVAYGTPVQSDSRLAADTIAAIYAGYVSAEKKGTEVKVPLL